MIDKVFYFLLKITSIVMSFIMCATCIPKMMFDCKFKFDLPETSKVEKFNCFVLFGLGTVMMKIRIDEADYQEIDGELCDYFESIGEERLDNDSFLIHEYQFFDWWDFDRNDVISAFLYDEMGIITRSIKTWAFITKDQDGQYYLYVEYPMIGILHRGLINLIRPQTDGSTVS